MSSNVIDSGCIPCGARHREAPASEESRPWPGCAINTGFGSLCNLCMELEQLQSQISSASQHLSRLLEKRYQLKERITLHHLLQKMPPEVLSNIFQFFISSDSESEQCDLHSSLILGSICGRWRAIAWSTPRLWNSISIKFNRGSVSDKIQLAREWLGRSGQLPLSISITTVIGRDVLPLPVPLLSSMTSMIEVINGYAHRWRVLDVRLPPSMLSLFHADPHGISILHTLRIDPVMLFPESRSENFNPTNPCPSPMVVKIDRVHFQSVRIRWEKITHLYVDLCSIDECFEVIRQIPSLNSYRLTSIRFNQNKYPIPQGILSHINLTSLDIPLHDDERMFFQHVSFPSLQFLSLELFCTRLLAQDLLSFLRRSSPPLHELHLLSFEHGDEDSIIQILKATPSLKKFHLHPWLHDEDYDAAPLFQCLSDSPSTLSDGIKFLPHLESMFYIGPLVFPWDLIPKVFIPRWRPLSNFRFHCHERLERVCIDETTRLQLQELKKRGISIEIKYTNLEKDFLDAPCK